MNFGDRPLIAIADDNEYLVELIDARFTNNRWRTLCLTDSAQVAPALAAHDVDLLILDVEMPGESGLQVLERLRRDPRTAALPVVMLTGRRSTADVKTALALGALEYVVKPFNMETLVRRVKRRLVIRVAVDAPIRPHDNAFEI